MRKRFIDSFPHTVWTVFILLLLANCNENTSGSSKQKETTTPEPITITTLAPQELEPEPKPDEEKITTAVSPVFFSNSNLSYAVINKTQSHTTISFSSHSPLTDDAFLAGSEYVVGKAGRMHIPTLTQDPALGMAIGTLSADTNQQVCGTDESGTSCSAGDEPTRFLVITDGVALAQQAKKIEPSTMKALEKAEAFFMSNDLMNFGSKTYKTTFSFEWDADKSICRIQIGEETPIEFEKNESGKWDNDPDSDLSTNLEIREIQEPGIGGRTHYLIDLLNEHGYSLHSRRIFVPIASSHKTTLGS
ncbi:MAG: hypothetical protein R3A11_01250 [Bdellovibrionota bacterium]